MIEYDAFAKDELRKQSEAELEQIFDKVKKNLDISAEDTVILEIVKVVEQ